MQFHIPLPPWLWRLNGESRHFKDDEHAMSAVLEVAARNVADGGGPFAAAVLTDRRELVAFGCNRVVPAGSSILHAEMVAMLLAQRKVGRYRLSDAGDFTLITSCEPCAMCFGAIPFAGLHRVVCGAATADACAAGFDEGDKPSHWVNSLIDRGIEVATGVLAEQAAQLLRDYQRDDGVIY